MKSTLLLLAFALAACSTTTETRPDGTVVKTWGVDHDAFNVGANAATRIIEADSGK